MQTDVERLVVFPTKCKVYRLTRPDYFRKLDFEVP